MVFLNPTILFGLLAASIPIVLHFLNLRKIKKIEFSTLAFLKELQKSKIKKIKIKQFLLLLLRILIVVFLVLSFSRPTSQSTSLSMFDSNAKTTAVIIVDNSFSMSLVNKRGSYLNQSKNIAKEISSMYGSNDELYVITTDNGSAKLISSPKNIDDIEISYVTTPLSKSLQTAMNILNSSVNLNKELFVFSDFQKQTLSERDSVLSVNINDSRIFVFPFENSEANNLSVVNLKIKNQIFEFNKPISLSSETANYLDNTVNNELNSIYFNNKRVAQKNISVQGRSNEDALFKTTIESKGLIEIKSSIEDDGIIFDNEYYKFIIVPDKVKVLLVGKSEAEFVFIKSVLQSTSTTSMNYSFINSSNEKSINFDNYDAAIIIGSGNEVLQNKIYNYTSEGGSIILFPEQEMDYSNENKLLSKLGIPIFSKNFESLNGKTLNSFDIVDFNHPVFDELFTEDGREIESPKIYKYLKLKTNGLGRSIISLQDNSSFLSEYRIENGKALLFNVHPNLEWSDFPVKNIFAPLLNRSLSYLVSNNSPNTKYISGDILSVNISKRKSNQIKIVRPDNTEEIINVQDSKGNFINYERSNLTGIYKIYSNNSLIDVKAVNYNLFESNLESLTSNEISQKFKNDSNEFVEISLEDDYKAKISSMRFGSEYWHMFLVFALLLALLEMFVAKSSKKDIAEL